MHHQHREGLKQGFALVFKGGSNEQHSLAICPSCMKRFASEDNKKRHFLHCKGRGVLMCDLCSKIFRGAFKKKPENNELGLKGG